MNTIMNTINTVNAANTEIKEEKKMNYVAEFYKTNAEERKETANNFFTNVEKKEEIVETVESLKKSIATEYKKIQEAEAKIAELNSSMYTSAYEPTNKTAVIYYTDRDGNSHYYTIPNGLATDPQSWERQSDYEIHGVDKKVGDIKIVVGFAYKLGAAVVTKYHYSISANYSKASVTTVNTFLIGVFDDFAVADTDTTDTWNSWRLLSGINGTGFLEKFYGVDLSGSNIKSYSLSNIKEQYRKNKSFEIILKTAPDDLKYELLNRTIEAPMPIHKIFGLTKETWNKAIELGLGRAIYELEGYINNPLFNKTEAEWLEAIQYIQTRKEDLDFYEINYTNGWRVQNPHGVRPEIYPVIGGLAYYYLNYTCFHQNYSFGKFCDYVIDETINQGYTSIDRFIGDLSDYLRMCAEHDITPTLYSSYLKQTHDIATRNYKLYISPEDEKRFEDRYKDFKNAYYNDYVVVAPKTTKEVRQEGNTLNHCVASYIKRIIDGSSLIVFLRAKGHEKESLITVEIANNAVVQVRGKNNRRPEKAEVAVLRKFADARGLGFSQSIVG